MKLTVKQLEDLHNERILEVDGKTLLVIEDGKWEQDHKFQMLEIIFTDGIKHYAGDVGRSGSPFTDWIYDSEIHGADTPADIVEVKPVEITKTVWKAVD